MGIPGIVRELRRCRPPVCGRSTLNGREGAGLEQGLEGRQTGGGRERVAGERARLVHGTGRGHHLHDGPLAPVGPQGKPSAYHLAQAGQIGLQSPGALGAFEPEPESGYHLVQYEQGARLPAELLDAGQETRAGHDEAHVGHRAARLMTAAICPGNEPNSSSRAARSLKAQVRVSLVAAAVTPGESGRPNVETPLPAWTRKASAWP